MIQLRAYQVDLINAVRSRMIAGARSLILQAPTGAGKTAMTAHMIRTAAERGAVVWFVNHRREIIQQSVRTLRESADVDLGIVASGQPLMPDKRVQVCSVNSLPRRWELLPEPTLIVLDEAHHTAAATWSSLIARYPKAYIIGLTATPQRLDGAGLKEWFECIVPGPAVKDLIQAGFLSRYRMFVPPNRLDLRGVRTTAGDYNKQDVAAAMESAAIVGDALTHYAKHAMGKRAVCFAWSIEASIELAEQFNAVDIPSAHIDGNTPREQRDRAIEDFRAGRILMLSNVDIVSEGFDLPAIEAAFLLRPTKSLGLYLQQVGRALRPAEGKTEALIFDHVGNCRRHGLPDDIREWSLEGRKKEKSATECPIRECPGCYAALPPATAVCPFCGHDFNAEKSQREMDQVDGELEEITTIKRNYASELRQCRTYEELLAMAYRRNYKWPKQWANHVLRERRLARLLKHT